MIEHYAGDAVRNANGQLKIDKLVTPSENLGQNEGIYDER